MKVRAVPEVLSLSGSSCMAQIPPVVTEPVEGPQSIQKPANARTSGRYVPGSLTVSRFPRRSFHSLLSPVATSCPSQRYRKHRLCEPQARQSTYMLQYSHEKWSPHNQIPPKLHRKLPLYAISYVIFKDFPASKTNFRSKSLPETTFFDKITPFLSGKELFLQKIT